jgi:hypothetical protein
MPSSWRMNVSMTTAMNANLAAPPLGTRKVYRKRRNKTASLFMAHKRIFITFQT